MTDTVHCLSRGQLSPSSLCAFAVIRRGNRARRKVGFVNGLA